MWPWDKYLQCFVTAIRVEWPGAKPRTECSSETIKDQVPQLGAVAVHITNNQFSDRSNEYLTYSPSVCLCALVKSQAASQVPTSTRGPSLQKLDMFTLDIIHNKEHTNNCGRGLTSLLSTRFASTHDADV